MPELTPGTNTCFCTGCHEYFNSVRAFDKHRVLITGHDEFNELRRCLTVEEMTAKGWSKNNRDCWIVKPMSAAAVHSRIKGGSNG